MEKPKDNPSEKRHARFTRVSRSGSVNVLGVKMKKKKEASKERGANKEKARSREEEQASKRASQGSHEESKARG